MVKIKDIRKAVLLWGGVSSEGIHYLRELFRKEEKVILLLAEERPYLIGLFYNYPQLKENNLPFVYCTDNTLGLLFYQGRIKQVLLFYKRKEEKGIWALSGSLYVCLLAKLHNVPCKIFPQPQIDLSSFDRDATSLVGLDFSPNKDCKRVPISEEFIEWPLLP